MDTFLQRQLNLFPSNSKATAHSYRHEEKEAKRAIESEAFPFEVLSSIAEVESWRKEVNRPIYHVHKWWAQRLGSVFRAIVLGTHLPEGIDVINAFYSSARLPETVIFDPFMGSGTTIGEVLKCGARAIGRDINPVSFFLVRNALRKHSRADIISTFEQVKDDAAHKIQSFYRAHGPNGEIVTTLYYFWVKQIDCPCCTSTIDLFNSYVFARHAYPKKFPLAKSLCPHCGNINEIRFDSECAECQGCGKDYAPQSGPARGAKATCPGCRAEFSIAKRVREQDRPLNHRLYAKLVLLPDGTKTYLAADEFDREVYEEAQIALKGFHNAFPVVAIEPGHNTNQARGYNYRYWHEFFNERQLTCLKILGDRIKQIPDESIREIFVCLFSGTLEFNNMFASYKGEGTGAVRHMFSHHILKPERMPLEANLWGTPKSSGAFSTLFESRILRALDYCDRPFELRVVDKGGRNGGEKVFGLSASIGEEVALNHEVFELGSRLYLSCGDSSKTDIATESVDSVITDPPFFDNVHYSELADFFHVWQRHLLTNGSDAECMTTRADAEVQQTESEHFTDRLGKVWKECHRVLKKNGLLVFTYHHSRSEGWHSVLESLIRSCFSIVAVHPIKAEMSGATPKHQAKEPIDLDIIVVCRKRPLGTIVLIEETFLSTALEDARGQVERLRHAGRSLSRNDLRVIVMAQLIRQLSVFPTAEVARGFLESSGDEIETCIEQLHGSDKKWME